MRTEKNLGHFQNICAKVFPSKLNCPKCFPSEICSFKNEDFIESLLVDIKLISFDQNIFGTEKISDEKNLGHF